jgi:hypothetical protein
MDWLGSFSLVNLRFPRVFCPVLVWKPRSLARGDRSRAQREGEFQGLQSALFNWLLSINGRVEVGYPLLVSCSRTYAGCHHNSQNRRIRRLGRCNRLSGLGDLDVSRTNGTTATTITSSKATSPFRFCRSAQRTIRSSSKARVERYHLRKQGSHS